MAGKRTSRSDGEPSAAIRLCLYVAGNAPNSVAARTNLSAALAAIGNDVRASVEIVDVFEQPDLAVRDDVFVTPMLLRLAPPPTCRVIGNLSDRDSVMRLLDVGPSRSR